MVTLYLETVKKSSRTAGQSYIYPKKSKTTKKALNSTENILNNLVIFAIIASR